MLLPSFAAPDLQNLEVPHLLLIIQKYILLWTRFLLFFFAFSISLSPFRLYIFESFDNFFSLSFIFFPTIPSSTVLEFKQLNDQKFHTKLCRCVRNSEPASTAWSHCHHSDYYFLTVIFSQYSLRREWLLVYIFWRSLVRFTRHILPSPSHLTLNQLNAVSLHTTSSNSDVLLFRPRKPQVSFFWLRASLATPDQQLQLHHPPATQPQLRSKQRYFESPSGGQIHCRCAVLFSRRSSPRNQMRDHLREKRFGRAMGRDGGRQWRFGHLYI